MIFAAREEDCLTTLLILKACGKMKLNQGKSPVGVMKPVKRHTYVADSWKNEDFSSPFDCIGKACGFRFHALCN